jgi:hypothetical protein
MRSIFPGTENTLFSLEFICAAHQDKVCKKDVFCHGSHGDMLE